MERIQKFISIYFTWKFVHDHSNLAVVMESERQITATYIQSGDMLLCGTYAFGDPIQTIGELAPQ